MFWGWIGKCPRARLNQGGKLKWCHAPSLANPLSKHRFQVVSFWSFLSKADWRLITGSYVHTLLLLLLLLFFSIIFWDFNNNRQIKTKKLSLQLRSKAFLCLLLVMGMGMGGLYVWEISTLRSRRAQLNSRLRVSFHFLARGLLVSHNSVRWWFFFKDKLYYIFQKTFFFSQPKPFKTCF